MTSGHGLTIVIGAMMLCVSMQAPHVEAEQLPQWPPREEQQQIVTNTKKLSAQALDSTLAPVPLEQWLKETLGAKATLEWEVGDCDLKPDGQEPPDGYPMCVVVRAGVPPRLGLRLHLLVGTFKRGVFGQPSVANTSFVWCSRSRPFVNGVPIVAAGKLSEIPANLQALSSSQQCK